MPGTAPGPSAAIPHGMPTPSVAAPMPMPMPGAPAYTPTGTVVIRKRRPFLNGTLTVLCLLVVAFVGWSAFNFAFAGRPPSALNGYLDGKGVEWTLPHTHTSVRMPAKPTVRPTRPTVRGKVVDGTTATVVRNSYEMMFVVLDGFGRVDASKEPALLDRAFHDTARAYHVDLEKTRDETKANATPRMIGHGSFRGDTVEGVITHRHARLIVLFVHAKAGATRVLTEMEKSLRVG